MSTNESLTISVGLKGQQQTEQGLKRTADGIKLVQDAQGRWRTENGRFATTAEKVSAGIDDMGVKSRETGVQVARLQSAMGAAGKEARQNFGAGMSFATRQMKYGALALTGLAVAGAKWGLGFNAQARSARARFELFTGSAEKAKAIMEGIDEIARTSTFSMPELSELAANLGNAGVAGDQVIETLQGVVNAAAASGRGSEALRGIGLAMSQIAATGKLQGDELRQMRDWGAPGVMQAVQQGLGLTADQLGNVGAQGIEATVAMDALTKYWTSGRMVQAAQAQTKLIGGQWNNLKGSLRRFAGEVTEPLADELQEKIFPAMQTALSQIRKVYGREGLSNEAKLREAREIIRRELGPVVDDLVQAAEDADLAGKLERGFEDAMNRMVSTAVRSAPKVVGGFVDAWLGAGPWAKLISGAWLAKKLGLTAGAGVLLRGLGGGPGGGKGGLGGVVGKAQPVPVWVMNPGFGGAPIPGGGKPAPVPVGRRVLTTARSAGSAAVRRAGPAAAAGATIFGVDQFVRGSVTPLVDRRFQTDDLGMPAGKIAPPGFGNSGLRRETGERIVVNPVVQAFFQLEGRNVASALAMADDRDRGRR